MNTRLGDNSFGFSMSTAGLSNWKYILYFTWIELIEYVQYMKKTPVFYHSDCTVFIRMMNRLAFYLNNFYKEIVSVLFPSGNYC